MISGLWLRFKEDDSGWLKEIIFELQVLLDQISKIRMNYNNQLRMVKIKLQ